MAATARREIDTGEEDIAAIAKQISDHAEAIYQTWKARGLAPTEILSCRPTPGIKLADSLRATKPRPDPKPEIKQRPEQRREQRPHVPREQPLEARRETRPEQRREVRPELEGETIEVMLPPDLVPERNGTGGAAATRRADPAAMRLEVAREEERLLRALRTGGVVAERTAERPDVVPAVSLVDYAKSRYQDRLDTGARKPATGAGERRSSLGSHVTEARSKFEARARRASSAGTGEPTVPGGTTPVRPFLTRGSVAERVLMFERCPSEATLELAKRKTPTATTWRGPHDVINRAQKIDERRRCTTIRQLEMMVEFLEGHRDLALGRVRSREARAVAARLWAELSEILNAEGPARTGKEWSKVWNDQKCKIRAKLVTINANQQGTGGGPSTAATLTPLEQRVANNILGRDVGPLPNVRQDQFALNDGDVEEVIVENVQEASMDASNVSPPIMLHIHEAVPQPTQEVPPAAASPTPSLSGQIPPPTPSRVSRVRERRRAERTTRQPTARAPAQSNRTALDESRLMILEIERMRAEAALKTAEAMSSFTGSFRLIAESIDRFSQMSYAATAPPKPSSAPAHTTLQRSVRSANNSGAPARVIPRFHFPKGRPPPGHQQDHAIHKVQSAFATFPNSQVPRESFKHIVKACECPLYWKMPLFLATQQSLHAAVDGHKFIDFWRELTAQCHDQASRFVYILTRGKSETLAPEDFVPLVQDVVDTHPGLSFLKEATEFHSRYVHTVIARIFYCVNRSWSGRISMPELRRSNLLQVIQLLEDEEDINQVTQYFSYEHFYVIYCKFWELDRDHDLFIDRHDLARHNDHALSSRMIERVLSGCVTRGNQNRVTPDGEPRMSYTEFVWFLLAEEDKSHPTAIEYWYRCMDIDGDGYISMYELEYFYEEQMQRMEAIGIETLPFSDCLCQMLDMVHPAEEGKITLTDLKRCKLTPIFFDTFFNLEKYLDHEQRDPFATQRDSDSEMSEWDRFAAEEYELLVAEEGGSDAQDQISYDETDEDCLSPNLDDVTSTEVIEDSSVEESTVSELLPGAPSPSAAPAPSLAPAAAPGTSPAGYVNLSSIYSIGAADRWVGQPHTPAAKNGFPEKKLPEKPVPPEKPVSLMMVNGKMDNRYVGFGGNNSFLYSHLLDSGGARAKDPPSYTAATGGALFDKNGEKRVTSPNKGVKSPVTSPVNGVNKISDNYERAVAERLSPQLTRLFGKVSAARGARGAARGAGSGAGAAAGRGGAGRDAEDDDYARDSDECSI